MVSVSAGQFWQKKNKRQVFLILGLLFLLNALAWLVVSDLRGQGLEIIFFDVEQGDSTLIKTPQGHHILIDGGPDSIVLEKLGKEMPFWQREIDLIVLTHPHYDHLSGFIGVLENYRVKNILWTGVLMDSAIFGKWAELIEKEQANIYIAKAGQLIYAGPTVLKILHPFERFEGKRVLDIDNTSIFLKVVFGNTRFLFTGDAFKEAEAELARRGIDLAANFLQVGHHGSRTSTAEEFLAAVLPQFAVISAGKNNDYGHPHPETLEILAKYDIKVFRTDQQGDIKVFSNGRKIKYGISNF